MFVTTETIHAEWDFEVEVIEYAKAAKAHNNETESNPTETTALVEVHKGRPVSATVTFRVRTTDLESMPPYDHRKKTFFQALNSWNYRETTNKKVTLKDESVKAMAVLFRVFHGAINNSIYAINVEEMWNIKSACDKYNIDLAKLQDWFGIWYSRAKKPAKEPEDTWMQTLMYPCYAFNHAEGFQKSTHFLVYNNSHHIMDHNPTQHRSLHLPARVIQQLNAARGRLKTILHRELWKPIGNRMGEGAVGICACRKETVFDYQDALCKLGVWPLEEIWQRNGVDDVIEMLRGFKWEPVAKGCFSCSMSYTGYVARAGTTCRTYFDGLCLDCMNMTKTGDVDEDFWQHNNLKKWDKECRLTHGQPTWYFSFMGRPDVMKQKNRRVQRSNSDLD